MNPGGRLQPTAPESALAAQLFDHFCSASTMKQILALHREICNVLTLKPTRLPDFYPKLKAKLANSWKAMALFKKFDARANHKVYNKGKASPNTRVLIIGAGPCGLRAAIECQLLGAKVVVIEKRDRMSRNNVLHLWPFVIHDLRALGAKKFFGKFCAGAIDHISIRQLQCILLKVALLLGVEFHEGLSFEELLEPTVADNNERLGWRARVTPAEHPVSQYEFDALIGADGKRNTLCGFKRKEFRGKLAIAITANFINRHTEQEASVQEISGVAFIFNQKFFKDLYRDTGIDLENIVYYKDDTHYFVMTAKKQSLIEKGVILKDYPETSKLLSNENIDRDALMRYAREAANFSTDDRLPNMDFALNHYGEPDVAVFDFTSMYAAENACMVLERNTRKLLVCLVGDSLLEPFWPTGSGCARGFLSALDAAWAVRNWGMTPAPHPLQVIAERESIYRLLGQTTPENLQRDFGAYTLEPSTRYPNLNRKIVTPHRVTGFYDSDDPIPLDTNQLNLSARKRKRDTGEWTVTDDALLSWFERATGEQLLHNPSGIKGVVTSKVLGTLLRRYRPDLLTEDESALQVLHEHFGIAPVGSVATMARGEIPDSKLRAYLVRVYRAFKGEVPHVHHETNISLRTQILERDKGRASELSHYSGHEERRSESGKKSRKRRSNQPVQGLSQDGEQDEKATGLRNLGGGAVARLAAELASGAQSSTSTSIMRSGKPRDLMRAVGRIDMNFDWNVREINKKIHENRLGRPQPKGAEKVPKWDRQQFLARQNRITEGVQPEDDEKWGDLNETLRKLDRKLNDSGRPALGTNKVADLKDKLVKKLESEPEKKLEPIPGKTWSAAGVSPAVHTCAACGGRVFAAEETTADGLQLHKACFRCAICTTVLRHGSYTMERWSSKLICLRHGIETTASLVDGVLTATVPPERIGLEASLNDPPEMDEDEWTDRNFLPSETSGAGGLSDDESSSSEYSEAPGGPEAARRGLVSEHSSADAADDDEDPRARHIYLSDDSRGYEDSSDDGVDSESCSMERKAREERRLEVPPPGIPLPTDSSEVETDESSDESSASAATEVSTDSEFAHEEHTPVPLPPSITVTVEHLLPSSSSVLKKLSTTDFPLARTRSAGGIVTKTNLELKKRYLLGEPSSPAVRKSDSTSQLDSKFELFCSNISEFQKLLNPASKPSNHVETIVPESTKTNDATMPDIILNLSDTTLDLIAEGEAAAGRRKLNSSILPESSLPKIEDKSEATADSDSLSDTDSSTAEAIPNSSSIPRVEIHNACGELLQLDSLTIGEAVITSSGEKETVQEKLAAIIVLDSESSESLCEQTNALTETEMSDWANDMSTLDVCIDWDEGENNVNKKRGATNSTDFDEEKNINKIRDLSIRTDFNELENYVNKKRGAWISSDFNEEENNANKKRGTDLDEEENNINKKRAASSTTTNLKGIKSVHEAKNISAFGAHICGKDKEIGEPLAFSDAPNHFAFADTGSQENIVDFMQTKNLGYLEFVDIDDDARTLSPVNDRSMNFVEKQHSDMLTAECEASVNICTINSSEGSPPLNIYTINSSEGSPPLNIYTINSSEGSPPLVEITSTFESTPRPDFFTNILKSYNNKDYDLDTDVNTPTCNKISKSESTPTIKCDLTHTPSDIFNCNEPSTPGDYSVSFSTGFVSSTPGITDVSKRSFSSSSSFDKNSPFLSKSASAVIRTKADDPMRRVEELKKEREFQTEVVRNLVLGNMSGEIARRSSRRQKKSPPPIKPLYEPTPPVSPIPEKSITDTPKSSAIPTPRIKSEPLRKKPQPRKLLPHESDITRLSPGCAGDAPSRTLGPSFSDPELATSHRRRGIIRTVSDFFNRRLGPRSKWGSEPDIRRHESSRSSGHALSNAGATPPPVPPPPAQYVAERRAAQLEDAIRTSNDADEASDLADWFTARRMARLRGREEATRAAHAEIGRREAKLRRRLKSGLTLQEEAAAVAELLQLSSRKEALTALHAQDRRRQGVDSGLGAKNKIVTK